MYISKRVLSYSKINPCSQESCLGEKVRRLRKLFQLI